MRRRMRRNVCRSSAVTSSPPNARRPTWARRGAGSRGRSWSCHPLSPTSPSVSPLPIVNGTPSTARTWPVTREKPPRRTGKMHAQVADVDGLAARGRPSAPSRRAGGEFGRASSAVAPFGDRHERRRLGAAAVDRDRSSADGSGSRGKARRVRHVAGITLNRAHSPCAAATRQPAVYGWQGRADGRARSRARPPARRTSRPTWSAVSATTPRSCVTAARPCPVRAATVPSSSRICAG